ncbi:hypothetical protein [Chitinivorax sp. B]|uniref:hypothetical protein n=1 Tax=Chitinivorax sp. B TaxID=2502235 RepID=UPI0010F5B423|nr:hypothetical protein [Chitinivorax sp. B]
MKNRRGFRYPLDPYRKLCAWELDEQKREMLDLASQEKQKAESFRQADQAFGTMLNTLRGTHDSSIVLDPAARGLWLQYLGKLDADRQAADEALQSTQQLRDEAFQRYANQHRHLKGLDALRERALHDFDKDMATKESTRLDDAWLQALDWKSKQNADQ